MTELEQFAKMSKEYRKANRLTIIQLAKLTGISKSTIGNYERAKRNPSLENVIKLANFYQVSIDELVGRQIPKEVFNG